MIKKPLPKDYVLELYPNSTPDFKDQIYEGILNQSAPTLLSATTPTSPSPCPETPSWA